MDEKRDTAAEPQLGLWDAVSIIVGIIIGVGIFEVPAQVFAAVPGPWIALGLWGLGSLFALLGALCFAELASTYPRSGGEYVYLTHAFGPIAGYLFGWAQLAVIRPGNIAALAYLVGLYGGKLWGLDAWETFGLAVASVVVLTIVNVLGVTLGKDTQNLLTAAKVMGLAAIVVVGFAYGSPANLFKSATASGAPDWFAESMLLILWTYDGWNEAAYIVAEVKNARRNLPLALLLGTTLVTAIYLIINAAFLSALGFAGAQGTAMPAQVLGLAWGNFGATAIGVLIIVSALGAINGMIFTTARIYSEFGADHRFFEPLSRWSPRWQTPVCSLLTQAVLTLGFLVGISAWISLTTRDNAPDTINNGFNEPDLHDCGCVLVVLLPDRHRVFRLAPQRRRPAASISGSRLSRGPLGFLRLLRLHGLSRDSIPAWRIVDRGGILLLGLVFFSCQRKSRIRGISEYLNPRFGDSVKSSSFGDE